MVSRYGAFRGQTRLPAEPNRLRAPIKAFSVARKLQRQGRRAGALLLESAGDSEANDAQPVSGCASGTGGGANLVKKTGPGTAAEAMAAAIAGHPCRSIGRRTTVVLVQAVLYPFPDIADHVMETESVRREGANRSGLCAVPLAAAASAIGIIAADRVSPG
jgi:hypothetical protein